MDEASNILQIISVSVLTSINR